MIRSTMIVLALVLAVANAGLIEDTDRIYQAWTEGRLDAFTEDIEVYSDAIPPFPEYLKGLSAFEHVVFDEVQNLFEVTGFTWKVLSADEETRTTVAEWTFEARVLSTGKPSQWKSRQIFKWNDAVPARVIRTELWPMDASKHLAALKSPGQLAMEKLIHGFQVMDMNEMKAALTPNAVFKWLGNSPFAGTYDIEAWVAMMGAEMDFSVKKHEFLHETEDLVVLRFTFDYMKYRPNGKELIGRDDPNIGLTVTNKMQNGKIDSQEAVFDREPSSWAFVLPPPGQAPGSVGEL